MVLLIDGEKHCMNGGIRLDIQSKEKYYMGSKYLYYVSGNEVIPMFDPQMSPE